MGSSSDFPGHSKVGLYSIGVVVARNFLFTLIRIYSLASRVLVDFISIHCDYIY